MQDLSLHVLDIAENSIRANACLIQIRLKEQIKSNELTLVIQDDGKGMASEMVDKVSSPFFTTRTTRRVGLGIALLKQNCEQSGGNLVIESQMGEGTKIIASMQYHHIDRLPIGDMTCTIATLIGANPNIEWIYQRERGEKGFEVDTRHIKSILEGIPINHPEIIKWIADYISDQENTLTHSLDLS